MYQVDGRSVYKLPFIMLYYTGWLQATKLNVLYTGSFFSSVHTAHTNKFISQLRTLQFSTKIYVLVCLQVQQTHKGKSVI
jgi:hypothetical protein